MRQIGRVNPTQGPTSRRVGDTARLGYRVFRGEPLMEVLTMIFMERRV